MLLVVVIVPGPGVLDKAVVANVWTTGSGSVAAGFVAPAGFWPGGSDFEAFLAGTAGQDFLGCFPLGPSLAGVGAGAKLFAGVGAAVGVEEVVVVKVDVGVEVLKASDVGFKDLASDECPNSGWAVCFVRGAGFVDDGDDDGAPVLDPFDGEHLGAGFGVFNVMDLALTDLEIDVDPAFRDGLTACKDFGSTLTLTDFEVVAGVGLVGAEVIFVAAAGVGVVVVDVVAVAAAGVGLVGAEVIFVATAGVGLVCAEVIFVAAAGVGLVVVEVVAVAAAAVGLVGAEVVAVAAVVGLVGAEVNLLGSVFALDGRVVFVAVAAAMRIDLMGASLVDFGTRFWIGVAACFGDAGRIMISKSSSASIGAVFEASFVEDEGANPASCFGDG